MTGGTSLLLLALSLPASAAAQTAPDRGWHVGAGGGLGYTVHRGDGSEGKSPSGVARVALERPLAGGTVLTIEWVGAWLSGDWGPESRHHLGVAGSFDTGVAPLRTRVGVGLGTATVVEVEGAPTDDLPGDISVGIGGYGSLNAIFGLEGRARIGDALDLVPSAEILLQRAGGATLATAIFGARLRLGL